MYIKKYWLPLFFAAFVSPAYADILVILPESGAMARASENIKRGFLSAYAASGSQEKIIFADSTKNSMDYIFKKKVNNKIKLVVGPLARTDIDAVMQLEPKLPVLALNDVNQHAENVWQFSLSKQHDAAALTQLLKNDRVKKLWVLRGTGTEAATELFMQALSVEFGSEIQVIDTLPKKISRKEGLLLLGHHQWIQQLGELPEKKVYACISIDHCCYIVHLYELHVWLHDCCVCHLFRCKLPADQVRIECIQECPYGWVRCVYARHFEQQIHFVFDDVLEVLIREIYCWVQHHRVLYLVFEAGHVLVRVCLFEFRHKHGLEVFVAVRYRLIVIICGHESLESSHVRHV